MDTPEFLDTPYMELLLLAAGMYSKDDLTKALMGLEDDANEEFKTEMDPEDLEERQRTTRTRG